MLDTQPAASTLRHVSAAVAELLWAHGVRCVFGVPGTDCVELFGALDRQGLTVVAARSELGAGYAADGYARASDGVGVVVTASGPGCLNALSTLAGAEQDGVSLLHLTTGSPRDYVLGRGRLHEVRDQLGAAAAVCGNASRVGTSQELLTRLAAWFDAISRGAAHPCHIEIPTDLLLAPAPAIYADPPLPATAGAPNPVDEAARLLREAKHPLIVAGRGARGASRELLTLAERSGARVATSVAGKGIFPERHPLALGATLHEPRTQDEWRSADVILAVGTRLAEADFWGEVPALRGDLIRIDIEESALSWPLPAHLGLLGAASAVLDTLARSLDARAAAPIECRPAQDASPGPESEFGAFADILGATLPPDTIIVGDPAMAMYLGVIPRLPLDPRGALLYPSALCSLGYALPAAIGARLALGAQRPIIAVVGDGGIQFTVAELATAAEVGGPLVIFVINNGGYGWIRRDMAEHGHRAVAVNLTNPDFATLAASYGVRGVVTSLTTLAESIVAGLASAVPTLIEVTLP